MPLSKPYPSRRQTVWIQTVRTVAPAFTFALFSAIFPAPAAAQTASPVVGIWYDSEGEGAIEVTPCGNRMCGRIVWLKRPLNAEGKPKWRGSEKSHARDPGMAGTFLINGRAPRAGEVFKNPELAKTYRLIAEGGRDAYYKGEIADKIVAFSDKVGGLFSKQDFADHKSEWIEPVKVTYRGYDVWELPPPGQGIAALQMLNLLEPHDLKKLGPNSPDYWHLLVEAKKLAFADRAKFYTDPVFAKVPVAELISKPYAAERGKLIDPKKAATDIPAGDPQLGKSETIYLTVVDSSFARDELKGRCRLGLYVLADDRLRVCVADDGKDRPTSVEPGAGRDVYDLERVKW